MRVKRSGQYGWMGVLCLLLLDMSSPLCAKVVYVSPQGDDLRDGLSWATAKRTVTAALQAALPGDQIWVRYGVYYERITLQSGVSMYGGFRGTESSLSERPTFPRTQPDPYETVLDGNQEGSVVTSPDSADQAFRLDGFTIRNGKAEVGGGLSLNTSASLLTVTNCTISNNSATYDGGGVYCIDSSPTLTGCTISANSAEHFGGGVFCVGSSSLTMTSCIVSANNSTGYSGGGVFCSNYSSLTMTNCTIDHNISADAGGVWTDSTDAGVQNSILVLNTGGGICAPVSSTFRHNCVWGNEPYNFEGDIGDPIGTDGNISEEPLLVAWHLLPGADEFHAPIVQGYLLFHDFGGSLPLMVDWEIRTDIIEMRTPLLAPDGGFVVPGVPVGQFALSVKPLSYLRRTVEVDTGGGSVLGLSIALTNGDVDGDNEVTLFDFGSLVAAFGSVPGNANWDVRADLDGDGEVTLFDFGVLVRHFGEIGDD